MPYVRLGQMRRKRHYTMVPPAAVVVATVDGRWMILRHGVQWGGTRDASGTGDATFGTVAEAFDAWWAVNGENSTIEVQR